MDMENHAEEGCRFSVKQQVEVLLGLGFKELRCRQGI